MRPVMLDDLSIFTSTITLLHLCKSFSNVYGLMSGDASLSDGGQPCLVPTEAFLAPVDHQSAPSHHGPALVPCPVGLATSGEDSQRKHSS